jgi:5-methylcytosine-specific restriction endonuclease McrA
MPTGIYKHHLNQGFQKGNKDGVGNQYALGCKRPDVSLRLKNNKYGCGNQYALGRKHTPMEIERIRESVSGENNHNWKGGITPEQKKFYSSPEWKEIQRQVWIRDKGICQVCGEKYVYGKMLMFEVHCIIRYSEYPDKHLDMNNLHLVCKRCHGILTGIERKLDKLRM